MFKVSVKRQDTITHQASFSTEEEALAWIEMCESQELWGPTDKEEILDEEGNVVQEAVVCPYVVEVKDLSEDYEFLLEQCHQKRRAEYPPVEEYLDALVKGDIDQEEAYIAKCQAVKAKYPKPERDL